MRIARIVAINIVVCCIVAELVGLAAFYEQHGWLFYVDPYKPTYGTSDETEREALTTVGLHPYFGPTHVPGLRVDIPQNMQPRTRAPNPARTTNNFGFVSPYAYPFQKTRSNQVVLGILGGSVGLWFCEIGTGRLIERLRASRLFHDKEIVPLCLSHEGYKQPQQLLVLTYFLSIGQQFDLVINIDGFNEVALASINNDRGIDVSMPSATQLEPLMLLADQSALTPRTLDLLVEINRDRQRLNRLASWINDTRSAAIYVALSQYYGFVERRYRRLIVDLSNHSTAALEPSLIRPTPAIRLRSRSEALNDIAAEWMASSILMNDLLRARGIPYFHFLQPNQYYSRRRFAGDEAAVALNASSPFKPGAEEGYPVLIKTAQSGGFAKRGVAFFDATGIFDNEPMQVYIDDCCHYTVTGNERLADFIAGAIRKSVE